MIFLCDNMSADLVSRRLRLPLSDWLSSNSVLREIGNEFEAEGVAYKPDPSQNAEEMASEWMVTQVSE
jgi:hypothetical protein